MTRKKSLQKKTSSVFEGSSSNILTQVEIHISEEASSSVPLINKPRLPRSPSLATVSTTAYQQQQQQQQQMPKFHVERDSSVDVEPAETSNPNSSMDKINTFLSVSQNDLSPKSQFRIAKNSHVLSPDIAARLDAAEVSPLSWSSYSSRTSASDSDMERCSRSVTPHRRQSLVRKRSTSDFLWHSSTEASLKSSWSIGESSSWNGMPVGRESSNAVASTAAVDGGTSAASSILSSLASIPCHHEEEVR